MKQGKQLDIVCSSDDTPTTTTITTTTTTTSTTTTTTTQAPCIDIWKTKNCIKQKKKGRCNQLKPKKNCKKTCDEC